MSHDLDTQLRALGLTRETVPDQTQWRGVVESVVRLLDDAAREREGLTQALLASSSNMQALLEKLTVSSEAILRAERDALAEKNTALERALADVAAERRAKAAFLASLSVAIRPPMNALIGATELLYASELSGEQRDLAATVRGGSQTLLTLLNDLVDLNRLEAGELSLESVDFDLRRLMQDVVAVFSSEAHARAIDLSLLLHHDVPPALAGDPGRLRQILLHLVRIALDASARSELTVRVQPLTPGDPTFLRFVVGSGADPEARLEQALGPEESGGFPLALVRHLVRQMGGELGRLDPGGFVFTLRLAEGKGLRASLPADVALAGRRVLLLASPSLSAASLSEELCGAGLTCRLAASASEAQDLLRAERFDFVIFDWDVPGLSTEEIQRFFSVRPAPRGIVLAAHAERGDGKKARDLGVSGYLSAPFSPSELIDCLAFVLISPSGELVTRHTLKERHERDKPHLLLVEDNLVNQRVLAGMLERLGCRVDVAATGRAAVEAGLRTRYDVILMDTVLPEMDGFAATEAIRRARPDAPHVPILGVVAESGRGTRERCLESGMDDVLLKPLGLESLARALRRFVTSAPIAVPPGTDAFALPELGPTEREGCERFVREASAQLDAIRHALVAGDGAAIRKHTRELRAGALRMSANHLAGLLDDLESEQRDVGRRFERFAAAEVELERTLSVLEARLSPGAAA